MSTVSNSRSEYWTAHFSQLAQTDASKNEQLDFSNHALVVQNYAYVLEACGAIMGKRVLDAGFGTGELARILDMLGGRVSAFDVVPTRIPSLRESTPNVAWWQGDLAEWTLPTNADPFDMIVAAESLQYVDFDDAVNRLLNALSPTGRLVILIPNSDCPIVQRTSERFDHRYVGVSLRELPSRFDALFHERSKKFTEHWYVGYRGIRFQDDQTLVPYTSEPWEVYDGSRDHAPVRTNTRLQGPHLNSNSPNSNRLKKQAPANRLQIVISRQPSKYA